MSCSKHSFVIKHIPEWESIAVCSICNISPSQEICGDDDHAFITSFPTISSPLNYFPLSICHICGHTGGEIIALGGRVNPNSDLWGRR